MIGWRRLMDDWMMSYFFYYLLCFMSYALELTVDGWLDDILFLRLSKCISQIWYKAVFVINTFWMHLNWSLSVLFVFMPQGIAQTSWFSCTGDKRIRASRLPWCVFYICLLTNKYRKYKSVELGDQLYIRVEPVEQAIWWSQITIWQITMPPKYFYGR